MKIKITFTESLLGTASANRELYEEYIASKSKDAEKTQEEVDSLSVDDQMQKSSTVFSRTDKDEPMLWDYQIKGFFKDAWLAQLSMDKYTKEELKKARLTQYLCKRTIDQLVFVYPRRIVINLNGGSLSFIERPLRAETMRGERIALARSEMAPAGSTIEIDIQAENEKLWPYLEECLDYGIKRGLGQWRNSGCGRFLWEKIA